MEDSPPMVQSAQPIQCAWKTEVTEKCGGKICLLLMPIKMFQTLATENQEKFVTELFSPLWLSSVLT